MSGFSSKTRAIIHLRAAECCELCGKPITDSTPRSVHHRRPRGMGGSKRPEVSSASNGLLVDGTGTTGCHGWIESNRAIAYDHGLLLRHHQMPAETPVLLDRGWTLLDDTGLYLPVAA